MDTRTLVWMSRDPDALDSYSIEWLPCVDYLVTTSRKAFERYQEFGYGDRVIRSQWACHPGTFFPLSLTRDKVVTFIGPPSPSRQNAFQYLQSEGIPLQVYGPGWARLPNPSQAEQLRLMSESQVNLAWSFEHAFEITATRSFCLMPDSEDLEEYFRVDAPGQRRFAEIACANNVEELRDKIRYYATHDREREVIAQRGYERTLREHTWHRRFHEVFTQIGWKLPPPPEN
jgi:hypothetical protein